MPLTILNAGFVPRTRTKPMRAKAAKESHFDIRPSLLIDGGGDD